MTRAALRVLVAFCARRPSRGVRRVRTVREVALPPVREVKRRMALSFSSPRSTTFR